MDANEDDAEKRYLASKRKMIELMSLRNKKAAATTQHCLDDEIVVVSDQEDGGFKGLDAIGTSSDVGSQTAFRCPQTACLCVFKRKRDLVRHLYNTHDDDAEEDVQLDQEISELNQESRTMIEIEEEADKTEEAEEAGEADVAKTNGRESIGTPASKDNPVMSEEDLRNDLGDEADDSATELEDDALFVSVASCSPTDDGRRFHCQHSGCASSFKHKKNLTQHQIVHTTRFQCQVCQKCFMHSKELGRHLIVHFDDRPFACDWAGCGETFKWEHHMKQHRKTVHSNERPFRCDKQGCGKSFKSNETLCQHLRFVHSSIRRFNCQAQGCDKRFKSKSQVKMHMNYVHYDFIKFRCHFKDCGKTFKYQGDVKTHMNFVHSDERPFKCTENGCDATFKTKGGLTRHIKTHSTDRSI